MAMSSGATAEDHRGWLEKVREEVLEPGLSIVDAHHHLWLGYGKPVPWQPDYWLAEFAQDLFSGHNIVATVFVECGYGYRTSGSAALKPVGEVETMDGYASEFEKINGTRCKPCAAIVGFANLRLGGAVEETLEAHVQASPSRFRGIRQITNWDPCPEVRYPGFDISAAVLLDATFQEGFARLARFDLSFDAWLFHPQIPEISALANRFPDTTIIVDHFGGPVGVGPYAGKRLEILTQWKEDVAALARHSNVVMKLGGINMEHAGFHWHERSIPPSSDELVAACGDYFLHAIDCFGPDRCMFESNFPVDKISCSYITLWNALKKLSARYGPAERTAMFSGTARRVYRMGT
jgi:predicted TIM-barrel fold metal-dependent hydrolase